MPISRSQMPRQMYGLGSFVKSIGKTIKKVVNSPIGKAAILGFGANAMLPGGLSSIFKGGSGLFGTATNFIKGLSGKQLMGAGAGILGLSGAFGGMEDQQIEELKSNPEALANYLRQYYSNLNQDATPTQVEEFVQRNMQANGGRIGYAEGSKDMILPMRKPKIEQMMSSNPGAAESGNPISRNNPVANLIDKYNTYKKAMPGVADETKTYLIEDFKKSLENSGISIKEFNMRLQEQNEMNEPVDMAYGGRMQYGLGDVVRASSMVQPVPNSSGGPMPSSGMGGMLSKLINSNPDIFKKLINNRSSDFMDENFNGIDDRKEAAYGGRMGYAFGTDSPENNAIQAAQMEGLPLNQNPAGVTELDLRDSGGFIPPVGVKEKADDIPAMLANNEFVFTADAVRGMGEGNVNKGAQRMYDMMKKLENGGRV